MDEYIRKDECELKSTKFMNKLNEIYNLVTEQVSKLDNISNFLNGTLDKQGLVSRIARLEENIKVLKDKSKNKELTKADILNWIYKICISTVVGFIAYKIGLAP